MRRKAITRKTSRRARVRMGSAGRCSPCQPKRDLEWVDIDEEEIEKREQAWRWPHRLEACLEYNVSICWSEPCLPKGHPPLH